MASSSSPQLKHQRSYGELYGGYKNAENAFLAHLRSRSSILASIYQSEQHMSIKNYVSALPIIKSSIEGAMIDQLETAIRLREEISVYHGACGTADAGHAFHLQQLKEMLRELRPGSPLALATPVSTPPSSPSLSLQATCYGGVPAYVSHVQYAPTGQFSPQCSPQYQFVPGFEHPVPIAYPYQGQQFESLGGPMFPQLYH